MMREPQPDVLVRLATKGHAQILDSLLKKWPDQVHTDPSTKWGNRYQIQYTANKYSETTEKEPLIKGLIYTM